jgi:hypothetical protein
MEGQVSETAEQLLQRILDEQGYVVIWHLGQGRTLGEVMSMLRGPGGSLLEVKTVVIAEATPEEWGAQRDRFFPEVALDFGAYKFYKVIAE